MCLTMANDCHTTSARPTMVVSHWGMRAAWATSAPPIQSAPMTMPNSRPEPVQANVVPGIRRPARLPAIAPAMPAANTPERIRCDAGRSRARRRSTGDSMM